MPSRGFRFSSIFFFVVLVNGLVQAQSVGDLTPGVPSKFGLNFAPAVVYGANTGEEIYAVAISDLNGDGSPDVVATGGDEVAVMLNTGDGTLENDGSYDSGGNGSSYEAFSVAVADLNGDGKPDIVVGNNPGLIGVLLGNGDGTFARAQSYSSGGYYTDSVAIADLNGDGKPDLIVNNGCVSFSDCSKGSIGILLGNGNGTFQAAITYSPSGFFPGPVVTADVNNDGRPDILVTVCTAQANGACERAGVAVLLGNGDGTFRKPFLQDVGFPSGSLTVADVNGDGKPDLVIITCVFSPSCSGGVGVLLGNGDGTFQQASYFSVATGAGSVVAADVNGDGKLDLVISTSCPKCAYGYNGAVGVLLGNGDGTFQPAGSYSAGGDRAGEVAVADLNGDGKPDIVVGTCAADLCVPNPEVGVLINTGNSSSSTAVAFSPEPSNDREK